VVVRSPTVTCVERVLVQIEKLRSDLQQELDELNDRLEEVSGATQAQVTTS
jgi:hypothetical protein